MYHVFKTTVWNALSAIYRHFPTMFNAVIIFYFDAFNYIMLLCMRLLHSRENTRSGMLVLWEEWGIKTAHLHFSIIYWFFYFLFAWVAGSICNKVVFYIVDFLYWLFLVRILSLSKLVPKIKNNHKNCLFCFSFSYIYFFFRLQNKLFTKSKNLKLSLRRSMSASEWKKIA